MFSNSLVGLSLTYSLPIYFYNSFNFNVCYVKNISVRFLFCYKSRTTSLRPEIDFVKCHLNGTVTRILRKISSVSAG